MSASARTGPQGDPGADGVGVPAGGTTGEVLAKASGTDFDTEWVEQTGGGGAVASVNGETGVVVLDAADVGAQPVDSDLTAIAALSTTAFGRALLALADAAAGRTAFGLGTAATAATGDFDAAGAAAAAQAASQPVDSDLSAIAALTTTSFGRSLLTLADAAALLAAAGAQASDSDLTAIAAIAASNDELIQRKAGSWTNRTPAQVKTDLALVKGDVGLGNVDNTADTAKPVSTAQQTALDLKANLASPTLTGDPKAPTPSPGDNDTSIATSAFVTDAVATEATARSSADALKAPLASPTFTGTPAAPTASQGTNTTQLATTAYVQTEAGLLVPKSLVDAKGDLLVGTADNTLARVAVGTDRKFLRADSSQSAGVAWNDVLGAFPRNTGYPSGKYIWSPAYIPGTQTTAATTIGVVSVAPIYLPGGVTFDRIECEIPTVGAAGAKVRPGVWNIGSNGLPSTVALDPGSVQADTGTGFRSITINWTPAEGWYAIGAVLQAVTATIRIIRVMTLLPQVGQLSGDVTGPLRDGSQPSTDAALTTFTASPSSSDRQGAIVTLRCA